MKATLKVGSYQRYCRNGHDTYKVGRAYASHTCLTCMADADEAYRERQKAIREAEAKAMQRREPVPHLKAIREKRSITRHALAWECRNLEPSDLYNIEEGHRGATYAERVEIFQALNVIAARREEERTQRAERRRLLDMAGLPSGVSA